MNNALRSLLRPVFIILAVFLCCFQIYTTSGIFMVNSTLQRVAHLSLVLCLVFLFIPISKKYKKEKHEPTIFVLFDICLAVLALAIAVYYFLNETAIV